jgi:CDGSH-type Zn-finger protein
LSQPSNLLIVQLNGPNMVRGDLVVVAKSGPRKMSSAMLCRCGASLDKPFCDGTHVNIGFTAPARLPDDAPSEPAGEGTLTITPRPGGSLQLEGPVALRGTEGPSVTTNSTRLCRCGASRRKPYCDGSHKVIGFK